MTGNSQVDKPQTPCFWHYDHDRLRRAVAAVEGLKNAVGTINPRPPGWHNALAQHIKRWLARGLAWYTRPVREFNASVSQTLEQIVSALEHLSMNMLCLDRLSLNLVALEGRLAQLEQRNAMLGASLNDIWICCANR